MKNSTFRRTVMAAGLAMSTILVGCGGGDKPQVAQGCTFPDAPEVAAQDWICDAPVAGVEVSAVGSAKIGLAGPGHAKQMAMTKARVQLAQMMKVHVANMIKQYVETTGAGQSETVDQVTTSVTKQITKETLVGTRLFRTKVSPNKTMYALVGLDEAKVQQAAEAAIKTSMKNERALWQQFKASKAQDELAAEISKIDVKQ